MYGRPTHTCIVWYCREPCSKPITLNIMLRPVFLWHLLSRVEDRANTIPPGGDTSFTTESHAPPPGGLPRQRHPIGFRKPKVFSLSPSAADNSTAVYISTNYSSHSSHWDFGDRVLERHGGKASIKDHPGDDRIIPGRPFQVSIAKLFGKADSLHKNMVFTYASKLLTLLYALKGKGQILSNKRKRTLA